MEVRSGGKLYCRISGCGVAVQALIFEKHAFFGLMQPSVADFPAKLDSIPTADMALYERDEGVMGISPQY